MVRLLVKLQGAERYLAGRSAESVLADLWEALNNTDDADLAGTKVVSGDAEYEIRRYDGNPDEPPGLRNMRWVVGVHDAADWARTFAVLCPTADGAVSWFCDLVGKPGPHWEAVRPKGRALPPARV